MKHLKAIQAVERILERELLEMKEFVGFRFAELQAAIKEINTITTAEMEQLSDADFDTVMAVGVLERLIQRMPAFVHRKPRGEAQQ